MKKRFSNQLIISILREAEAGVSARELCRNVVPAERLTSGLMSMAWSCGLSSPASRHRMNFNGRFRDECLNEHWFSDIIHARKIISEWRKDYNECRPHSTLSYLTLFEFAAG